jgi:hypothetical protein
MRIIARFSALRKAEIRSSDNPLSAVWRALQRFSGVQQATKLFPVDSAADIAKFNAYIELADGFAAVAEDADIILDPLLLYYATMWLSRALIAVKLGISHSASLKAHGAR